MEKNEKDHYLVILKMIISKEGIITLEDIREYSDLGVSHIIFDMRSTDLSQTLEKISWFSEQIIRNN